MMPATPNKAQLPNGFVTVQEAIDLIGKDTRDNAVVDTKWMMENILWVEKKHNFNIPLLKHENGTVVPNGHVYVYVENEAEKYNLRKAIQDHYEAMSGRRLDINGVGLKAVSTMVGDDNTQGVPMHNSESNMKFGSEIKTGTFTTSAKGN